MRPLHVILPAALAACLLAAPTAFAAGGGEDTPLNLPTDTGGAAEAAHTRAGGGIVRTIVGLLVVLGVIYGLHWVLKQVKSSKESKSAGQGLETLASLPLGTNRSLHLVRVGREIVLLGAGEHAVTPIRRYSEADAQALGLLDGAPATLADLEPAADKPKNFIDALRAKTVVK
jgi:flagellar protein FliO/FliZ